ncbi:hypothetical protein TSUD_88050, partial [Trifolium subterraneum]
LKPLDSISCWSQSSVWSPLCSNQGSSEGSLSPKEPSESANSHDSDCYDLSRVRQEQILALQQKLAAYRESNDHVSPQFQKKGKGTDVGFGMGGLKRTGPLNQQAGSEKPLSQGESGSRGTSCGTGKGCSTVLIPERVVQALQLHFDQMAATSGPKPRVFPPLHDVLVSTNRDGMYSLQKRQSRKNQTHAQNDMILPGEWTY